MKVIIRYKHCKHLLQILQCKPNYLFIYKHLDKFKIMDLFVHFSSICPVCETEDGLA